MYIGRPPFLNSETKTVDYYRYCFKQKNRSLQNAIN